VAEEAAAGNPALRLSVIHADAEDEAQELLEKASSKIKPRETHLSYATLVIGVHTGPGALGIIIERDMQA
jgi:fatty acid-binding protein DegV